MNQLNFLGEPGYPSFVKSRCAAAGLDFSNDFLGTGSGLKGPFRPNFISCCGPVATYSEIPAYHSAQKRSIVSSRNLPSLTPLQFVIGSSRRVVENRLGDIVVVQHSVDGIASVAGRQRSKLVFQRGLAPGPDVGNQYPVSTVQSLIYVVLDGARMLLGAP